MGEKRLLHRDKKAEQEKHRRKVVRANGFDRIIFGEDGSEYCETEVEVGTGSSSE